MTTSFFAHLWKHVRGAEPEVAVCKRCGTERAILRSPRGREVLYRSRYVWDDNGGHPWQETRPPCPR